MEPLGQGEMATAKDHSEHGDRPNLGMSSSLDSGICRQVVEIYPCQIMI
jgi:hypothetical protein